MTPAERSLAARLLGLATLCLALTAGAWTLSRVSGPTGPRPPEAAGPPSFNAGRDRPGAATAAPADARPLLRPDRLLGHLCVAGSTRFDITTLDGPRNRVSSRLAWTFDGGALRRDVLPTGPGDTTTVRSLRLGTPGMDLDQADDPLPGTLFRGNGLRDELRSVGGKCFTRIGLRPPWDTATGVAEPLPTGAARLLPVAERHPLEPGLRGFRPIGGGSNEPDPRRFWLHPTRAELVGLTQPGWRPGLTTVVDVTGNPSLPPGFLGVDRVCGDWSDQDAAVPARLRTPR